MSEADPLLEQVQAALRQLGLEEHRTADGWVYKDEGNIAAQVGRKRGAVCVYAKLPQAAARAALTSGEVQPHPLPRLAATGWVCLLVISAEQIARAVEVVRTSAAKLRGKR